MEVVHKVLPNNEILRDLIQLVNEGQRVVLPVKGNSMLPVIIGGRESVELVKPETVAVGDVVLAWVEGCRYVVHRIVRIDGTYVTLMGDGNLIGTEQCTLKDIKAIATHVVDTKERTLYLYNRWRKSAAKIWFWLRPIRRYLLAIYRRL